jgi:DNA (cytosine-5)-methyltransferase 1
MRALDLYCGIGGVTRGYQLAGFHVTGVDKIQQPRYVGDKFMIVDAFRFLREFPLEEYDFIHASPPCQFYSRLALRHENSEFHPNQIGELRELLKEIGKPYVIENVVGAPLINPIMLCGTNFPELRVIRHRLFESNLPLEELYHKSPHPPVYTLDKRNTTYGQLDEWKDYVQVTGGSCTIDAGKDAMGIDWLVRKSELVEAIPPAYTKYIGVQIRELLK